MVLARLCSSVVHLWHHLVTPPGTQGSLYRGGWYYYFASTNSHHFPWRSAGRLHSSDFQHLRSTAWCSLGYAQKSPQSRALVAPSDQRVTARKDHCTEGVSIIICKHEHP